MKTEWKDFLANAGAIFDGGRVMHFGNPGREIKVVTTGSIVADLSHMGLIAADGEETIKFLQSQLCNDMQLVSGTRSQLSALCSPKGRILALLRIFLRDDTVYLRLPQEILEATINTLKKYILMTKVTLEDASDAFVRLGFSGPHAAQQLGDVMGDIPDTVNAVVKIDDLSVIRISGPHPRFEIIGAPGPMRKLWGKLDVHAALVGADAWDLLDILAGIPNIYKETMNSFIPQMVNLQAIDAISFTKGCYPGQEVVARTQYLGKLKRRMYLAHLESDRAPVPGDSLYTCDATENQSIGKIVAAQTSPDGAYDVLAVVTISGTEQTEVRLNHAMGPKLVFRELPYNI